MHVKEDAAISKGPVAKTAESRSIPGFAALDLLLAPATSLPGVGPRLAGLLDRLCGPEDGPARCLDLLLHLPQGLVDHDLEATGASPPAPNSRGTLLVEILGHRPGRGPRQPYRIDCASRIGALQLVYFNGRRSYLEQQLPEGASRVVSGTLARFGSQWQIAHPDLITAPEQFAAGRRLQPVYRSTEGLHQKQLARLIEAALARLPDLPEWQDPAWLAQQGWPGFGDALRQLHQPAEAADLAPDSPARARLAFDELLAMQLTLSLGRQQAGPATGRRLVASGRLRRAVLATLPFELTAAQSQALAEIDADLAAERPMLRLLQGDVGSGKTLVACLAALTAIEAGCQAALMAPTEVLARQHAKNLGQLLAPQGLEVGLMAGRERAPERRRLLAGLAEGTLPLVVGTHALFQAPVAFQALGLAVIDEQHRFGVHQRLELAGKGEATDVLVMTATPIPRSLVLALYGDIALSELREKPAGRRPIETRVMPLGKLEEVAFAVERLIRTGQQLYWVCPLVAPTEASDLAAAEARHAMLQARFGAVVGLLHGRMSAAEKARTMAAFAEGRLRLLVATTVIEVGVDVAGATAIVIEHAERFGLAQLHQLRGRVGRSDQPSACLLLYGEPLGQLGRARLEVMRATEDGFKIAAEDLRLRGPGELLGTRQSGLPALRLADLGLHGELLAVARDDARLILARDPALASPRGQALRRLLAWFDRPARAAYLRSG